MKWQKIENIPQLSAFFFCIFNKLLYLCHYNKVVTQKM